MYMDITQQAGLRTGHQVALDNRLGRVLPDLDPLLNLLHDSGEAQALGLSGIVMVHVSLGEAFRDGRSLQLMLQAVLAVIDQTQPAVGTRTVEIPVWLRTQDNEPALVNLSVTVRQFSEALSNRLILVDWYLMEGGDVQ